MPTYDAEVVDQGPFYFVTVSSKGSCSVLDRGTVPKLHL